MNFRFIGYRAIRKSGKCPACGKRATRVNTDCWQTVNPFNKRADGIQKSERDIWDEVNKQVKDWESLPTYHARCEATR